MKIEITYDVECTLQDKLDALEDIKHSLTRDDDFKTLAIGRSPCMIHCSFIYSDDGTCEEISEDYPKRINNGYSIHISY